MDSWRQSMSAEGCSSSESGWTMYIASPMEEDGYCSNIIENEEDSFHGGDNKNNRRRRLNNKRDEDSDDSMASDASSGPTNNNASKKDNKKDHSPFAGKSCSSSNKKDKKRIDSRMNVYEQRYTRETLISQVFKFWKWRDSEEDGGFITFQF